MQAPHFSWKILAMCREVSVQDLERLMFVPRLYLCRCTWQVPHDTLLCMAEKVTTLRSYNNRLCFQRLMAGSLERFSTIVCNRCLNSWWMSNGHCMLTWEVLPSSVQLHWCVLFTSVMKINIYGVLTCKAWTGKLMTIYRLKFWTLENSECTGITCTGTLDNIELMAIAFYKEHTTKL